MIKDISTIIASKLETKKVLAFSPGLYSESAFLYHVPFNTPANTVAERRISR